MSEEIRNRAQGRSEGDRGVTERDKGRGRQRKGRWRKRGDTKTEIRVVRGSLLMWTAHLNIASPLLGGIISRKKTTPIHPSKAALVRKKTRVCSSSGFLFSEQIRALKASHRQLCLPMRFQTSSQRDKGRYPLLAVHQRG